MSIIGNVSFLMSLRGMNVSNFKFCSSTFISMSMVDCIMEKQVLFLYKKFEFLVFEQDVQHEFCKTVCLTKFLLFP